MSFQIDFPAQPRFPLLAPLGSAAAPSYSFTGDPNTGIFSASADRLDFATAGGSRWSINSSGFLIAAIDASYDIGGSSSTFRPRNIYASNTILASAGSIGWTAKCLMQSPSDGVMVLFNAAGTDFTRLQFGGTTSAFPCIKRSSTTLHFRLADDSAFATIEAAGLTLNAEGRSAARLQAYYTTAIPAGGSTGVGVWMSSTPNFGVFFGSGAPTLSAAKGSLYLRSDGSGTGDRMYVNTDGSTAWTAVTTAT